MAKQLIPLGAGTNPNGSRVVPFLPLKNQRPDPVRHSTSTPNPKARPRFLVSVRDPAFVRYLERLGEERLATFSTHDFLTLAAIAADAPLTDVLRERLPGLVEAGAIESQGRGRGVRYLLSRSLHATLTWANGVTY